MRLILYLILKRQAAVGVDGETRRYYSERLEVNLHDLTDRFKTPERTRQAGA